MSAHRKRPTVAVRYYAIIERGRRAHIVELRSRKAVCGIELPGKGHQVAIADTAAWHELRMPVCASCDRMKDADTMSTIVGRSPR